MSVIINGSAGVTTNSGAVYNGIQGGTAVASTSGTSIDFTSIPSWVKRITVMFSGVSTNSTSPPQIQLGDSGGIETTGYLGSNSIIGASAVVTAAFTSGFGIGVAASQWTAATTLNGAVTINLLSSNLWSCFGVISNSAAANTYITSGSKTLSDVLTQIRITTVNGTDTFDAGSINILFE
jgi:hypothetical protein